VGAELLQRASERPDPILEVTGIAAAEILRRCRELRESGRATAARPSVRPTAANTPGAARGRWRLLDFADLGDTDFVRDAHRVLLGRSASPSDIDRRLRELGGGSSRMAMVVRLALSPEGRCARRPPVRGIGLPALAATAAAIEALKASPVLGRAAGRGERVARSVLARPASSGRTTVLAGAVAVAGIAVVARRSRS
jgi:hypothetical protein